MNPEESMNQEVQEENNTQNDLDANNIEMIMYVFI